MRTAAALTTFLALLPAAAAEEVLHFTTLPHPELLVVPSDQVLPFEERAAVVEERFLPPEALPPGPPPDLDRPGWFSEFDVALLFPNLAGYRMRPPGFQPFVRGRFPRVDAADLDGAGSLRFALGYRLANGMGDIAVAFRFTAAEQEEILLNGDPHGAGRIWWGRGPHRLSVVRWGDDRDDFGAALVRSRLHVNSVDLQYGSRPYNAGRWQMKWEAGARIGTFFAEDQVTSWVDSHRASSHFVGAGPYLALGMRRDLGDPADPNRLSLFARLEAGVLIGESSQALRELVLTDDAVLYQEAKSRRSQGVPMFGLQAGLSWHPAWALNSRMTAGYQFDGWWNVGRTEVSDLDLILQGIFFRWEWCY